MLIVTVVPNITLAQSAPFTVTSVSAVTTFNNNTDSVLLNGKHVIKVKSGNSGVYIAKNVLSRLINTSGKNTPTPAGFAVTSLAPEVTVGPYNDEAFYLKPNTEYSITTNTTWDTNQMFAGAYYSALKEIYYTTSATTSAYTSVQALDFRTPVVAVVGEKAPYLTSVIPSYPSTVVQGDLITITGERLAGGKVFVANYDTGIPSGNPVQLTVASSTQSTLKATIPTTLRVGKYLIYLTNNSGQSNSYVITVSAASTRNSITGVLVNGSNTSSWVQGTNKNVYWSTRGNVPTVDVLVCIEPSNCFFAYKNIVNNEKVNNVRVGTNIPVGSKAYIKVRQAGTETVAGKSPSFTVTTGTGSPLISLRSASQSVTAGDGVNDDVGTFTIKFDVTALDDTLYLPMKTSGYIYQVQKNGVTVATTSGISTFIDRTTSEISPLGNALIEEGEKHTFELISSVALPQAGTVGQYRLVLSGVKWDKQDKATLANTATVDFKTPYAALSSIDSNSQVASVNSGLQNVFDRIKTWIGFAN